MPTITISVDDEAYDIIRSLAKGKKSSAISGALKIWYRHLTTHDYLDEFAKEMNPNDSQS